MCVFYVRIRADFFFVFACSDEEEEKEEDVSVSMLPHLSRQGKVSDSFLVIIIVQCICLF